jgi:hypothetical protein
LIEFRGKLVRPGGIARREQLNNIASNVHAAGGIQPRSDAERNIAGSWRAR